MTVVRKMPRYAKVIGNKECIDYSHLLPIIFADTLPKQIDKLLNLPQQFFADGFNP